MKEVTIYTDGACHKNPGPGGWAAVLLYEGHRLEISGGEALTTNNRMEMTAAIRALEALKMPCEVRLHSDSAYLIDANEKHWLQSWIKRGWLKADRTPVENVDLWKRILELTLIHRVQWIKVKGHADDPENNRCDELAVKESRRFLKKS